MVRVLFRMDHEYFLPLVCFTEIQSENNLMCGHLWQSLLWKIIGPRLINISFFGIPYWVLSQKFILTRKNAGLGHVNIQANKSCDWWVVWSATCGGLCWLQLDWEQPFHAILDLPYCREFSRHLIFAILENWSKPSHLIFHDLHFRVATFLKTRIIGVAKLSYNVAPFH